MVIICMLGIIVKELFKLRFGQFGFINAENLTSKSFTYLPIHICTYRVSICYAFDIHI